MPRPTRNRALPVTVRLLTRAALLFGFWLLLSDNPSEPELITGGVVALAASAAAVPLQERTGAAPKLRIRPPMLARIHRPFVLLVSDTGRVTWALARALLAGSRLEGRIVRGPYGALGEGPEMTGRRVLSEWGDSLGPNRYVIGIDRDTGEILVH